MGQTIPAGLAPAADSGNPCGGTSKDHLLLQTISRKEQRLWRNPNPNSAADLQGAGAGGGPELRTAKSFSRPKTLYSSSAVPQKHNL